jgi:hypothetical protein
MSRDNLNIEITEEHFITSITDEVFQISVDGAMANTDISNKISSLPSGDWKKITSMEYNPITGNVRINYES